MTGGYRRTPVMQIGADIYCDTQCIIRELERRFPEPTLFPEAMPGSCLGHGDVDGQGVLSEHREPRLRLARRQGPAGIHRRPRKTARRQIRRRRDDGRDPADARPVSRPCAVDRSAARRRPKLDVRRPHQPVRYQRLHERLVRPRQSSRSSTTCSPNFRPRGLGNADARDRAWHLHRNSTAAALEIGTRATPQTAELADPHDPNGRKPGDQVEVMPDDYGKIGVRGEIVALSSQHIAIRRTRPDRRRSGRAFSARGISRAAGISASGTCGNLLIWLPLCRHGQSNRQIVSKNPPRRNPRRQARSRTRAQTRRIPKKNRNSSKSPPKTATTSIRRRRRSSNPIRNCRRKKPSRPARIIC